MVKIRNFDKKSEMNRQRVRKFREKQNKRLLHERQVQERIRISSRNADRNVRDKSTDNISESNNENTHESMDDSIDFKEKLMCWSVKHCVTKRALNDLLSILIVFGFNLPKDSRTLMKTPVHVDIRELSKGYLWYHGISKYLQLIFQKICNSNLSIRLDFNFDGVEIFNSSKKCFWPIIASIRGKHI